MTDSAGFGDKWVKSKSTRRVVEPAPEEELKLLLGELSQSPPGIPGLARNSIAFMLMMILAVAIVHILAVAPPEATKDTVSFGDAVADMTTAKCADREVTVNVPAAAKPGKVHVILIPKGTDRKLISNSDFEVLENVSVPSPTDNESDIDGCDVAIADATSD